MADFTATLDTIDPDKREAATTLATSILEVKSKKSLAVLARTRGMLFFNSSHSHSSYLSLSLCGVDPPSIEDVDAPSVQPPRKSPRTKQSPSASKTASSPMPSSRSGMAKKDVKALCLKETAKHVKVCLSFLVNVACVLGAHLVAFLLLSFRES